MHLVLVNPANPFVGPNKRSWWSGYAVWKPLGLLIVASLTPPDWSVTLIDENVRVPDYGALPRPDLVGITAFTSQAHRAYQIAAAFRQRGVPVAMGGIHASMCLTEALEHVDAVVTGEAESVWGQVLADARQGALQPVYRGELLEMDSVPPVRAPLQPPGYRLGSVQTTRGCPLNCSFCSVTAFNGGRFRHRPIANVLRDLQQTRERVVLMVDDNLVGTRSDHLERTKELLRAMVRADLGKRWVAQATINMADDDELLRLAARSGCCGVFIGFETPSVEGLAEIRKTSNVRGGRDLRDSVRRMQRHGIPVLGAFILGLDVDHPGIGRQVADAASHYGVDVINVTLLTPLPGTRLWAELEAQNRIVANNYPEDWRYYTLSFPVARYMHLSWEDILREREECIHAFYGRGRIAGRVVSNLARRHSAAALLVGVGASFSHAGGALGFYRRIAEGLDLSRGASVDVHTRGLLTCK